VRTLLFLIQVLKKTTARLAKKESEAVKMEATRLAYCYHDKDQDPRHALRFSPRQRHAWLRCGCAAPPPRHFRAPSQAPPCARGFRRLPHPVPFSLASSLAGNYLFPRGFFPSLRLFFCLFPCDNSTFAWFSPWRPSLAVQDPPGFEISTLARV